MEVMSPKVVLGAAPDPLPPLPQTFAGVPIWADVSPLEIGPCAAWEYRHTELGRCVVLQLVALLENDRAVYVAWVPADARDGLNPIFAQLAPLLAAAGTLVAYWDCNLVDGCLIPELTGPHAAEVIAAWPEAWRVRLPGDALGDPMAVSPVPAANPTGPLCLGAVLA